MSQHSFSLPAEKRDGKWIYSREKFEELAHRLPDGKYDFIVERYVQNRSGRQNRAYWACIVRPCSESSGYEEDQVHEILKFYCNPVTVSMLNKETGEIEDVTVGRSTANLNTEEFSLYFQRCQQFAAEQWNCVCPDPDQEYAFR